MLREKDKFKKYEITKRIGRGRFATVWQAFDPQLDDIVAIKEITIDSGKEKDAKNAIREGRLLRSLNSTHILSLWDIGIENDCVYLIMEYADGGTLSRILERGPLSEAQVRELLAKLCDGLTFAHDKGVVHRDLKPENLFISGGTPKIGDFGLGKILRGSQRATSAGTGTLGYIAPEQYRGNYDKRVDIWAMGMITLELLTGELPFDKDADEPEIMFQVMDPNQPIPIADSISPAMREVLKKALAKNVEERFQSAAEMRDALIATPRPKPPRGAKRGSVPPRTERPTVPSSSERGSVPFTENQPKTREKDSMKMVYIPAGTFMMGSDDGEDNEKPVHEVYTDSFYMDEYAVTNEQYCKFLNSISVKDNSDRRSWLDSSGNRLIYHASTYCRIKKIGSRFQPTSGYENHPAVNVYWSGANAYAKWVGGRLPTEAEWEKAARGGLVGKKYPNGDSISHDDANFNKQRKSITPVKSFAPNGYGLYDMAGNVYEWCADWWDANYYKKSPKDNPTGPSSGKYHVARGGSWYSGSSGVRCGCRDCGVIVIGYCGNDVGFRVVVASGVSK